ncbi:hypothetical protein IKS38_02215 [bacterium]|nr:hypothetical protein [bacterium]
MRKPSLTILILTALFLAPRLLSADAVEAKPSQPLLPDRSGTISSLWDRPAGTKSADDPDGDGLLTENELTVYSTDPKVYDSDEDGLCDGEEVLGYRQKKGVKGHYTAPLYWDTDGDGLGDGEDADPNVPFMRGSFEAWSEWWEKKAELLGIPWIGLDMKKKDYDADSVTNFDEFKNGTCPFMKPGKKLAFFAPGSLTLSKDHATTTTVSAVFFADHSVTGMLCLSVLNLPGAKVFTKRRQGCEMCDGLFMPFDMRGSVFLSRYAVPMDLVVILPKATEKMPSVDYLRIRDNEGYWKDRLEIKNPLAKCAPPVPELVMPLEDEEIMETGKIKLLWQSGSKKCTFHLRIFIKSGDSLSPVEGKKLDRNWDNFEPFEPNFPGIYVWQVACENEAGLVACSESRAMKYLPPIGMFDTDGDGVTDNEEVLGASDPDDPNSTPLTIRTPEKLPDAFVKEHYYFNIMASGGVPPYEVLMLTPGNPPGFLLKGEGLLLGLPEREGTYRFTIGVRDQKKITRKKVFTLTVKPQPKSEPTANPK